MNSFYFASSILRGNWFLEPTFIESQGAIIANYLNKYTEFQKQDPDLMTAFAIEAKQSGGVRYSWYSGFDKAPEGSIAVVRIRGALMKEDQDCGPIGMESIGEIIKSADAHHNIDAIVMHIDSPGGTVDGTEALANIVKGTQKPVVTFVDGLMASAAFWIGSSADEIIASTDTDYVGSVGVISSFVDIQPYWENLGIKFHNITATTSPDKNKLWEDVRAGKYDTYRKEILDVFDEKFMNAIKENLPNIKEEHLTAKIYFARDVMGIMVDSIGTLEDAILRASELAQSKKENTPASNSGQAANNNQSHIAMNFPKLQSVLGLTSFEVESDGRRTFTVEEMQALEVFLAAANSSELQSQLTQAQTDLQTAQQASAANENLITERDQTIATLKGEIATLKAGPAEQAAIAVTEQDTEGAVKPGPVSSKHTDLGSQLEAVSKEYLGKSLN